MLSSNACWVLSFSDKMLEFKLHQPCERNQLGQPRFQVHLNWWQFQQDVRCLLPWICCIGCIDALEIQSSCTTWPWKLNSQMGKWELKKWLKNSCKLFKSFSGLVSWLGAVRNILCATAAEVGVWKVHERTRPIPERKNLEKKNLQKRLRLTSGRKINLWAPPLTPRFSSRGQTQALLFLQNSNQFLQIWNKKKIRAFHSRRYKWIVELGTSID